MMDLPPCPERVFPFRIDAASLCLPYLRWFRHLSERLGIRATLSLWKETFAAYDDSFLVSILSSGWGKTGAGQADPGQAIGQRVAQTFAAASPGISMDEITTLIENSPPIRQVRRLFSDSTMQKEIGAYQALHIRFDSLALLAERLIGLFGKQGELIVYDMLVEGRLAASAGETGSVRAFLDDFTDLGAEPSLFTAGLQFEVVSRTDQEAVVIVHQCEWARYFRERHPSVGYLMACSTDEAAYRAFNRAFRLQRTMTLMEGADLCDFRVYAVENGADQEG